MKRLRQLVSTMAMAALLTVLPNALAQSWTQTSAPIKSWSAVASSADGAKLVAAVSSGTIFVSPDSGATWTPTGAPVMSWASVASSADGSELVAVVSGG